MSPASRSPVFTVVSALLWCLCRAPAPADAHPHVFIENRVQVVFDDSGMTGVRLKWTLDEMFSNVIITDCDADGNGTLSPAEQKKVEKTYFQNLAEYDYFTHITIDGTAARITTAENFQVSLGEARVIYSFFVPCRVPATKQRKKVVIGIYDHTYYCDVLLVDYGCTPDPAAKRFHPTIASVKNTEKSFYFGQIAPEEITVAFSKAP